MSYVIDKFIADYLNSTLVTSVNINSTNIEFKSLTLDGTLQPVGTDTPNFDFGSVTTNYSDNWIPEWTANNKAFQLDQMESGALLSSGKYGLISSFDRIDTQRAYITVGTPQKSGSYSRNVIEPFYVNSVKFFHTHPDDQLVYTEKQSLNMKSSILTTNYKIIDRINNGGFINVSTDLFVPRQIPFSNVQTIKIRKGQNHEKVMMFHEVYGKDNLKDVNFNNNTIHQTRTTGENVSVYLLSGKGYTDGQNRNDPGREVAFATIYVIEEPGQIQNVGFNVYQDNTSKCYNSFEIDFYNKQTDTYYNDLTIHIFSVVLTDHDFSNPLNEAKRIALTIYMGTTSPSASLNKVRADHVIAWSKLWQTNIVVTPKAGIPQDKEEDLHRINRVIRTCLYNIYSASRETIVNDPTQQNMSILDINGSVINDGDIWLVPLMLFINPLVARSILDLRYSAMNTAQQIAGSYGFSGAKYPYIDNVTNAKDGVHWDVLTPLSIFNNAMISINTWNYYRVSKDKQWLRNKGYDIMSNIADFLVGIVDYDDTNDRYTLRNVIGMNGIESKADNSFTNNMVKLALRFVLEASYELSVLARDEWLNVYLGLRILYTDDRKKNIKFDSLSIEEDTYSILEMFFILTPYYSKIFFENNDQRRIYPNPETIKSNIDYYINKVKTKFVYHPYNIALLAILYGLYAQYDENFTTEYENYLKRFMDNYEVGIWNHLSSFDKRQVENSLNMNAIFLMIILQGMTEMQIQGGVSETRFYYEELKIKLNNDMNMPNHWSNIRVSKLGFNKTNYFVRNNKLFIANSQ